MNTREKMSVESRGTLLHEWDDDKRRYRLVSVAKFTKGYEDKWIIEELTSDSLGEPRWDKRFEWDSSTGDLESVLVSAIKSLVRRY